MVVIAGRSTLRDAERRRKQGVQTAVPETPTTSEVPVQPEPIQGAARNVRAADILPSGQTTAFDPMRRGGGGLSADAGAPTTPLEAQTLKEASEMIEEGATEQIRASEAVPVVEDQTKTVEAPETEGVTVVKPPTPQERIRTIREESEARVSQIEGEPARLTKTQDIAAIQRQASQEIRDVEQEERLEAQERQRLGTEFKQEVLEERITGARDIAQNEGISLTAALQRFDQREAAKAKLDPESKIKFDAVIDQITQPGFDSSQAFNLAIAEYEKDGVDADDMQKANDAVAAVFGKNFADEREDDFLINTRKIAPEIVQNDRKLIDAKKVGETVKSGQAGARVTNSYLKTIFDTDPSLVPDAISQILASDATDDAKRQASAFSRDFFTDVETGIGTTGEFLTEAQFKAGGGTPEERRKFEDGFVRLEQLKNLTGGNKKFRSMEVVEGQLVKVFSDGSFEAVPRGALGEGNRINEDGDLIQGKTPSKEPTTGERGALTFYDRMNNATTNLQDLEDEILAKGLIGQTGLKFLPGFLAGEENRRIRQAQREFTEARLRKDSGAAIPETEFENDKLTYFPQPGDKKETLEQKRESREVALEALRFASGNAYIEKYGETANDFKLRNNVVQQQKEDILETETTDSFIPEAVEVIKSNEGFDEVTRLDIGGVPTLGFGFTTINGQPVKEGDTITREEAEAELAKQLPRFRTWEEVINVDLNNAQKAALTSFTFNLGQGIWKTEGGSKLSELINNRDFDKARDLIRKFNKFRKEGKLEVSKGLSNRREREAKTFA